MLAAIMAARTASQHCSQDPDTAKAANPLQLPRLLAMLPVTILQESLWPQLDDDSKWSFRLACSALRVLSRDIITGLSVSAKLRERGIRQETSTEYVCYTQEPVWTEEEAAALRRLLRSLPQLRRLRVEYGHSLHPATLLADPIPSCCGHIKRLELTGVSVLGSELGQLLQGLYSLEELVVKASTVLLCLS